MATEVAAGAVAVVVIALAACVALGMVLNSEREFSRGVSSIESVVVQEVAGALTLLALALSFHQAARLWRGKDARALMIFVPIGLVLTVAWGFALLVQRAS
ncbi:MAG TPA: hypothetical protein VKB10_05360 [Gaiellaceae bacterium]|nr:hypothetical protein [Gaiellaceae bacterium]